jgi:hypothetical protein
MINSATENKSFPLLYRSLSDPWRNQLIYNIIYRLSKLLVLAAETIYQAREIIAMRIQNVTTESSKLLLIIVIH